MRATGQKPWNSHSFPLITGKLRWWVLRCACNMYHLWPLPTLLELTSNIHKTVGALRNQIKDPTNPPSCNTQWPARCSHRVPQGGHMKSAARPWLLAANPNNADLKDIPLLDKWLQRLQLPIEILQLCEGMRKDLQIRVGKENRAQINFKCSRKQWNLCVLVFKYE